MKRKLLVIMYCALMVLAVIGFKPFALDAATYTQWIQDPDKTIAKYKDKWSDRTIVEKVQPEFSYQSGDEVGTITIPRMNYYDESKPAGTKRPATGRTGL